MSETQSAQPYRMPPLLTDLNREFWTSGADGTLKIMRCADCRRFLHPPTPACRYCRSVTTAYEPVSGRGTVASYTVNHQKWSPDATSEPYLIGTGMPMRVVFQPYEDVTLPLFEPA